MLVSLIELRDARWELMFDEEESSGTVDEDDITKMIDNICTH